MFDTWFFNEASAVEWIRQRITNHKMFETGRRQVGNFSTINEGSQTSNRLKITITFFKLL